MKKKLDKWHHPSCNFLYDCRVRGIYNPHDTPAPSLNIHYWGSLQQPGLSSGMINPRTNLCCCLVWELMERKQNWKCKSVKKSQKNLSIGHKDLLWRTASIVVVMAIMITPLSENCHLFNYATYTSKLENNRSSCLTNLGCSVGIHNHPYRAQNVRNPNSIKIYIAIFIIFCSFTNIL